MAKLDKRRVKLTRGPFGKLMRYYQINNANIPFIAPFMKGAHQNRQMLFRANGVAKNNSATTRLPIGNEPFYIRMRIILTGIIKRRVRGRIPPLSHQFNNFFAIITRVFIIIYQNTSLFINSTTPTNHLISKLQINSIKINLTRRFLYFLQ